MKTNQLRKLRGLPRQMPLLKAIDSTRERCCFSPRIENSQVGRIGRPTKNIHLYVAQWVKETLSSGSWQMAHMNIVGFR